MYSIWMELLHRFNANDPKMVFFFSLQYPVMHHQHPQTSDKNNPPVISLEKHDTNFEPQRKGTVALSWAISWCTIPYPQYHSGWNTVVPRYYSSNLIPKWFHSFYCQSMFNPVYNSIPIVILSWHLNTSVFMVQSYCPILQYFPMGGSSFKPIHPPMLVCRCSFSMSWTI